MTNKNKKAFVDKVNAVSGSAPLKEVKKKKKVGRKPLPKELKKNNPVMANFTDDEFAALEIIANERDRSISSLVRMAALSLINNTMKK